MHVYDDTSLKYSQNGKSFRFDGWRQSKHSFHVKYIVSENCEVQEMITKITVELDTPQIMQQDVAQKYDDNYSKNAETESQYLTLWKRDIVLHKDSVRTAQ